MALKGKRWNWTKKGLPLHSDINVFCPKFLSLFSYCLWFSLASFLWGNGVKGPKSSSVLVLNAKGDEIKATQLDQPTTCEFQHFSVWSKPSYCKISSLVGEKFDYGKTGEFLVFHQNYSWKIFWFAK
jgi:hypothetical protein